MQPTVPESSCGFSVRCANVVVEIDPWVAVTHARGPRGGTQERRWARALLAGGTNTTRNSYSYDCALSHSRCASRASISCQ